MDHRQALRFETVKKYCPRETRGYNPDPLPDLYHDSYESTGCRRVVIDVSLQVIATLTPFKAPRAESNRR